MKRARTFIRTIAAGLSIGTAVPSGAAETTETIVLLRHGEKPPAGLGQIDCQGLNRALALPPVINRMFGKPDAIFAPNPSVRKEDRGRMYDYIRPLATIEPTAVAFGLPVDTSIGQDRVKVLHRRLEAPELRGALVLIAWEHRQIPVLAQALMKAHGGDPDAVPDWKGDDFDSFYVLRITRDGRASTARFEHLREGLDGQPMACPVAVKQP